MKLHALTSLLIVASVGCNPRVTTSVTKLSSGTYTSKPPDCEIQILTQIPSDKKYIELAILNATSDTDSVTKKDFNLMLPSLKAKACELGANAVLIKNVEQGGQWVNLGNSAEQTPTKAFCVAILLTDSK